MSDVERRAIVSTVAAAGWVTTTPVTPDWSRLEASLAGELLLPGSPEYDLASAPARPLQQEQRPAAIVMAANPGDVAATIAFGRAHHVPTVPRSGGHCFAGRSSTSGVLLDVTPMNRISVSGRRVTVGAGARLVQVYDTLEGYGLTLPAGTWPSVGIAGHALGGGMGFLGRAYGLTCDRLVAAEIVLAGGGVIWCDEDREPDLFWALRGAGGGQFGVVTSMVFDAVPLPAVTCCFHLTWPAEVAAAVIEAWQTWLPQAPDEVDVNLRLIGSADPRQRLEVNVFGLAHGDSATDTRSMLADLVDVVGTAPTWVFVAQRSYLEAVRMLAGLGTDQPPTGPGMARLGRSEYFRRPMPPEVAAAVVERLDAGRTLGYVQEINFSPWGGAYNRMPVDATAFAHRAEAFIFEPAALVSQPSDAVWTHAQDWLRDTWSIAHEYGAGGVYPNFPDPELTDWDFAYHRTNLDRLRQIKRRYDPDNWFHFHQSIAPAA